MPAQRDAEAAVQGLGKKSRPRRRAHEREGRQVHLHRAGHRAFADQNVQAVVLHGGVEDLLDLGREAVDLVHEEDIPGLQVRENAGQIPCPRDHRPGRHAQPGGHLAGDDVGERRLAEARRTGQEDVIEGLAPAPGGRQEDREVLADLLLADVLGEGLRPQLRLDGHVVVESRAGQDVGAVAQAATSLDRKASLPSAASAPP
jgi:hypothetical protein